jgi:hypothetical protein
MSAPETVTACDLPSAALLQRYRTAQGFADCYVVQVDRAVTLSQFIVAFYTTPLFKVERAILKWFARRPSTDADARALAAGESEMFAAWRVEARANDQILLADFLGRTRSWLMVESLEAGGTRLYFGSGIVPKVDKQTGQASMGIAFNALLGFHHLYSRALLAAARKRLQKQI